MRKALLLILLSTKVLIAQEVCETPDESLEDLNSITKCSIKPSKKSKNKRTRQISVRVSASKRRFLKKKPSPKKKIATSLHNLNTSEVSKINNTTEISNSLDLKEDNKAIKKQNAISNITALTNSMSAEEIKKAEKFSTVDDIPMFTSCTNGSSDENLNCFNSEMMKHIQQHFRYPTEAMKNSIEGEVWVRFIIDKNGDVKNIKTVGPENGETLEEEAKRVVTKLPNFKPAKKRRKPISVKYGFPINFSLEQ